MIDLYAAPTTNGIRAKVMLDECGLDYALHRVDLRAGDQKTPEFLAMNPMGQTPVVVDDSGPAGRTVLSQSVAILFYLAEKSGRFLPADPAARAAFWTPMMNAATDLGPTYGAITMTGRLGEAHEASRQALIGRLREIFGHWDEFLRQTPWCVGTEITIADFAVFGILSRTLDLHPQAVDGYGNLTRWNQAMRERPGVRKGLDFG